MGIVVGEHEKIVVSDEIRTFVCKVGEVGFKVVAKFSETHAFGYQYNRVLQGKLPRASPGIPRWESGSARFRRTETSRNLKVAANICGKRLNALKIGQPNPSSFFPGFLSQQAPTSSQEVPAKMTLVT